MASVSLSCPLPFASTDRILLGHGSGGKMTAELLARCFLPAFRNEYLDRRDDQAVVTVGAARLAFTTDSYVVTPLFFPGGDIGALAVNGTVNDLAAGGTRPLYLSAAFILEEGFAVSDLERIVASMRAAAEAAGVFLVTGDTKVVDRGKADGCFITTTGIGLVEHTLDVLATGADVHCLRDPTRGGVATALNELAQQSSIGIVLDERAIAINEPVRGVCELLGLDPLYVANEGKMLAIVAGADAEQVLATMRRHPESREARVVGEVVEDPARLVVLKTSVGGRRIVDMLQGEQLPRIC